MFIGILVFIAVACGALAIWATLSERKEAKASGLCSHCGQTQATKKLPKGQYVCKDCYQKLEPVQRRQIQQEKQAAEAALAAAKPVYVDAKFGHTYNGSFYYGSPDSAGGYDVSLNITNRTNKTVKYVIAELIPYNAVGDIGFSPTVNAGKKPIRVTGPINPHCTMKNQIAKNCWYDFTIAKLKVGTVEVIFMDGTTKTFVQ